ncbi:hypothetical protein O181_074138 [Austropuccinia psidii MF-1]|uniref:Uncharacterized protein n=1 Tax=Austropuccinia psidii MF-1 TaxID=1389203 RepID=A0A9Q3F6D8_9BASI|nr:hypothetical protein [Austropuccinia psidii MF-1]
MGPRGPTTSPQGQVDPKPQVGSPELIFVPQSQQSQKWPKGREDPNWPRTTVWQFSTPGFWKPPEATRSSPESVFLNSGEGLSFTNVLPTKESRMVHIWYNIPLCTNFAQKLNGDVFRTKLCLFNSSTQIHHPFHRKPF